MQKLTTIDRPLVARSPETHAKPPRLTRAEREIMTPDELMEHKRAYWRWNAHQRYLRDPDSLRQARQRSRDRNRERVRAQAREGERRRYAKNPQARIKQGENARMRLCLIGEAGPKTIARFEAAVGCSVAEFKAHLEGLFVDGMSWQNRGRHGWHVDHIVPLSSFDLTDPNQRLRAYHFTNTQPLWAGDNRRKMVS